MAEKISVNGALIDKDYFEENIEEARNYNWSKVSDNFDQGKSCTLHCMLESNE